MTFAAGRGSAQDEAPALLVKRALQSARAVLDQVQSQGATTTEGGARPRANSEPVVMPVLARIGGWSAAAALSGCSKAVAYVPAQSGRPAAGKEAARARSASSGALDTDMAPMVARPPRHAAAVAAAAARLPLGVSDARVNVACVGAAGTGKTALLRHMSSGSGAQDGVLANALFQSDLDKVRVRVGHRTALVYLWDVRPLSALTRELARTYVRSAQVVLLCVDVTNPASLEDAVAWAELVQQTGSRARAYLVANKIDLIRQRAVSLQDLLVLGQHLSADVLEVTCARGFRATLRAAFERIVEFALREWDVQSGVPVSGDDDTVRLTEGTRVSLEDDLCATQESGCFGGVRRGRRGDPHRVVASTLALAGVGGSRWSDIGAMEALRFADKHKRALELAEQTNEPRPLLPGQTRCPLGCGEAVTDKAMALQHHMEGTCSKRRVSCPLGCGERIPSDEAMRHAKEECMRRAVLCRACGELILATEEQVHRLRWRHANRPTWGKSELVHWLADAEGETAALRLGKAGAADAAAWNVADPDSMLPALSRLVGVPESRLMEAWATGPSRRPSPAQPDEAETPVAASKPSSREPNAPPPKPDEAKPDEAKPNEAKPNEKVEETTVRAPAASQQAPLRASIAGSNRGDLGRNKQEPAGSKPEPNPTGKKALLAGISGFDRSKLNHNAATGKERPDAEAPSAAGQTPLMAGIAGFDRSKLKNGATARKEMGAGAPAPAAPPSVMGAIAGFDRNKLKHVDPAEEAAKRREQQQQNPQADSGNPLMAALMQKLGERRNVVRSDSESDLEFA